MMRLTRIDCWKKNFPLTNTFRTNLGEKKWARNVWLRAELDDGTVGWGEAATSLARPEETQETITRAIQKVAPKILNCAAADWQNLANSAAPALHGQTTALSALECALWDAEAKTKQRSFYQDLSTRAPQPFTTSFTIPALAVSACKKIIEKNIRKGFRSFKVKLNRNPTRLDLARAELVFSLSKNPLILDANQAFNGREIIALVQALKMRGVAISLLEQPVQKNNFKGLGEIERTTNIPVCADESLQDWDSLKKLLQDNGPSVFNIKIAKLGLQNSLKMIPEILKRRKKLMLGCMMESALGLAPSVALAATGKFTYVDLDSIFLLRPTMLKTNFQIKKTRFYLSKKIKGTGIS